MILSMLTQQLLVLYDYEVWLSQHTCKVGKGNVWKILIEMLVISINLRYIHKIWFYACQVNDAES